jgi:hypothetical protein
MDMQLISLHRKMDLVLNQQLELRQLIFHGFNQVLKAVDNPMEIARITKELSDGTDELRKAMKDVEAARTEVKKLDS